MPLSEHLEQFAQWLPPLTQAQLGALEAHLQLLFVWNQKINLTAILDLAEAARRHIAESLFLAAQLPPGPLTICDLGSGGGFPGIPVGITRPDCQVTLVESDVRKSVFLREASRSLPNVKVVASRFEQVQGRFDCLISRAVNISTILGGPDCSSAAFLTKETSGPAAGLFHKWKWRSVSIPWATEGGVLLGEPVSIG